MWVFLLSSPNCLSIFHFLQFSKLPVPRPRAASSSPSNCLFLAFELPVPRPRTTCSSPSNCQLIIFEYFVLSKNSCIFAYDNTKELRLSEKDARPVYPYPIL